MLNSILNWIASKSKKYKDLQEENDDLYCEIEEYLKTFDKASAAVDDTNECYVKFSLNKDQKVDVHINVPDEIEEGINGGKELGELLYSINSGMFAIKIGEIIKEYNEKNPEDMYFVDAIVVWANLLQQSIKEDDKNAVQNSSGKAIIQPYQVFRKGV